MLPQGTDGIHLRTCSLCEAMCGPGLVGGVKRSPIRYKLKPA